MSFQTKLFDAGPPNLPSLVRYVPGFFEPARADAFARQLVASEAWSTQEIVLFGRRVREPRLVSWAGARPYRYSGKTLPARVPSPLVQAILAEVNERVEELARVPANHVLLNYYRDGNDSMGLHADDEPELGPSPVIVSLSLGAPRTFRFVPREKTESPVSLVLDAGSVLVMKAGCQARYRHELPKVKSLGEARVNLTFRRVLTDPS